MTPTLVDSSPFVSPRPRPEGPVVMYQSWKKLLFLHWEMEPADIQSTLPAGLSVDTWNGAAWLGIIPFFMRGVRPRFCPSVPGISNFLELNVRTYVLDRHGRPGVWFYSLDCNQPLAVAIARVIFRLPYFSARMRAQTGPESETVYYDCRRDTKVGKSHYEYRGVGACAPAREGSLEQFLVERYRLFSKRGGQLFSGEVWHPPYEIAAAEAPKWCATPIQQAGLPDPSRAADHAMYSPGVDVSIFPLRRVDSLAG